MKLDSWVGQTVSTPFDKKKKKKKKKTLNFKMRKCDKIHRYDFVETAVEPSVGDHPPRKKKWSSTGGGLLREYSTGSPNLSNV